VFTGMNAQNNPYYAPGVLAQDAFYGSTA